MAFIHFFRIGEVVSQMARMMTVLSMKFVVKYKFSFLFFKVVSTTPIENFLYQLFYFIRDIFDL